MSTRPFSSVVQRIIPHVPGCPHPIVERFVRSTAIDACEKTLVWRYKQPPIRLTPGVYDYPYEIPEQSDIHAFLTVTVNGRPLHVATIEDIIQWFPSFPDYDPSKRANPRYIFQVEPRMFGVLPMPGSDEPYNLNMVVALKPLRDSSYMNRVALDELEDAIMHGVLKELLMMPDKNWTSDRLAGYHAAQYSMRLAERRARANLGVGRASMSVQARPLA